MPNTNLTPIMRWFLAVAAVLAASGVTGLFWVAWGFRGEFAKQSVELTEIRGEFSVMGEKVSQMGNDISEIKEQLKDSDINARMARIEVRVDVNESAIKDIRKDR